MLETRVQSFLFKCSTRPRVIKHHFPCISPFRSPFFVCSRPVRLMTTHLFLFIHVELPPPAKRRRGLAGSIVSTAVSAALIGTAVGLTVYRL